MCVYEYTRIYVGTCVYVRTYVSSYEQELNMTIIYKSRVKSVL